jgi:RNA polymerase sigma-70 factor (ECF subfamily)
MLGSASDAEDVVQETWLRWDNVDQTTVDSPRAYLVRMVTRQALNRLRTESRRREEYVGEWLPEPLLTSPDVAEDVELAESISIAMLTVLPDEKLRRHVDVRLGGDMKIRPGAIIAFSEIAKAISGRQLKDREIGEIVPDHLHARVRRHLPYPPAVINPIGHETPVPPAPQ